MSASGCSLFRLAEDLKAMERSYVIDGIVANSDRYEKVYAFSIERDPSGRIVSADRARAGTLGAFAFVVEGAEGHYVLAYADLNDDDRYQVGEPAWFHADSNGRLAPVDLTPGKTTVRLSVELDPATRIADDFLAAARAARNNQSDDQLFRNSSIPISLGEIADLDEERFSNEAGSRGLWEPLSFPLHDGIGIFFLEPYDPDRIPVLFVYGAGGSPQNWRYFFDHLDRELYQPWFFFYPTGRRLDEVGRWLDEGVALLHDHFTFRRMHVVAHSMGGLVARAFLLKHVRDRGTRYIETFVTLSTPWAGHQAAASGVARSPSVVPAWYDLSPGSEFLSGLFRDSLREYLDPYLLFSFRGSRTPILPASNDGVVSLESQLAPAAQAEALALYGFDDAHMEIVSDPEVFALVERLLRGEDK